MGSPRQNMFERLRQMLESLLGPDWFSRQKGDHPALGYHDLCSTFATRTFDSWTPELARDAIPLARLVLDASSIIRLSGADPNTFALGDFSSYGDPSMSSEFVSRLQTPEHFQGAMLELCTASYLSANGVTVQPLNEKHAPDLLAIDGTTKYLLECKNPKSENAVKSAVETANKQIRDRAAREGSVAGILILGLLGWDTYEAPKESVPRSLVLGVVRDLRALLRKGQFRSISAAYVVWDEAIVADDPPSARCFFTARRRVLYIQHPAPHNPIGSSTRFAYPVTQNFTFPATLRRRCKTIEAGPGVKCEGLGFPFSFREEDIVDGFMRLKRFSSSRTDGVEELTVASGPDPVRAGWTDIWVYLQSGHHVKVLSLHRVPDDRLPAAVRSQPVDARKLLVEKCGLRVACGGFSGKLLESVSVVQTQRDGKVPLVTIESRAPGVPIKGGSPLCHFTIWGLDAEYVVLDVRLTFALHAKLYLDWIGAPQVGTR